MSVQLLDKTRKINKLLHNNNSSKVVFNDICDVLTEILKSNVLVISRKGKVLGTSEMKGMDEIDELIVDEVGGFIDPELNERLLGRHLALFPISRNTRRSLHRLILPENVSERCLSIGITERTI